MRENGLMPLMYEKLGIAFQYPDNWELDEQDALLGEQSVAVYSPGGAFWCVAMQPGQVEPIVRENAIQLVTAAIDKRVGPTVSDGIRMAANKAGDG